MTKKKILSWGDAPTAGTGFGTVSKYVLGALHETGKYNIHQLAINFHGDFLDQAKVPWQMQPARLLDPKDPHGIKMFYRSLMRENYDIVWILNDLFIAYQVVESITKIREKASIERKQPPTFIYYYPVDCNVQQETAPILDTVDIPVCYTDHGRRETLKVRPSIDGVLKQIPHGVNSSIFRPLPKEQVAMDKVKYFGVDPSTFIVVLVNRNSTRKQIPYSILAFKEFKKLVPNSIMYCHTMVKDQGADLIRVMEDLGLSTKTDVVFPAKYSPANPAPEEILNRLYNTGDLFLATHLGEGWGLSVTESMAAGTPVVVPNNTCMSQQIGVNEERGYMYPCNDWTWVDSSGFRQKGIIPDIVNKMMEVYKAGPKFENKIVHNARKWAVQHDWKNVTKKWIDLFNNASDISNKRKESKENILTLEV